MTSNWGEGDRQQSAALPGPQFLESLGTVHHHVWADDGGLVGVEFSFTEGSLLAQIVLDTDEVVVSFVGEPLVSAMSVDVAPVGEVKRVDVTNSPNYRHLIGGNSLWRWVLVNQQEYQDAFQIELEVKEASDSVTLQYLGIAGLLQMRSMGNVEGPTRV